MAAKSKVCGFAWRDGGTHARLDTKALIALFDCTVLGTAIAIVVVGVVAGFKTFDETIAAGARQRALIGMSVIAHITVFDATGGGTAITVGGITIIALFGVLSSTVTAVGARATIGTRTVAKTLTLRCHLGCSIECRFRKCRLSHFLSISSSRKIPTTVVLPAIETAAAKIVTCNSIETCYACRSPIRTVAGG